MANTLSKGFEFLARKTTISETAVIVPQAEERGTVPKAKVHKCNPLFSQIYLQKLNQGVP